VSRKRATAVERHTLKYEGAPFDDAGNRIVLGRWARVGGVGRAKCSCGELSQDFSSSTLRKAWHRRHKHLKRVEEFLSVFIEDRRWPFTEDDRCNITGYGHQDCAEFARTLTAYDEAMIGEYLSPADSWTEKDVIHRYAVFDFVDDDCANIKSRTDDGRPITPDTRPECVPITTVWGQR
jgi:hypothetical protein